jgi:hypothetical protein
VEVGEVYRPTHWRTNKEPLEVVTAAGKRRARWGEERAHQSNGGKNGG